MSSDDEFERRLNNKIETIVETQANLQGAIAELIKVERIQNARIEENSKQIAALMEVVRLQVEVARRHDERLDRIEKQQEENGKQIGALREQGKEQDERLNALIRIVEGHLSNHP